MIVDHSPVHYLIEELIEGVSRQACQQMFDGNGCICWPCKALEILRRLEKLKEGKS